MRYDVVIHDAPCAFDFDMYKNNSVTVPDLNQKDMEAFVTMLGRHGVEFFVLPFLGNETED